MPDDRKEMSAQDARALLDTAVEVLRRRGAEGDVYLEHNRTLQLKVREGRLEDLARAEVRGLAIRAMHEGRLGFAHTTAVDPDGVARSAEKAVELSRGAGVRDDLVLGPATGPGDGSDEGTPLGIYDAALGAKPIEEKQQWLIAAEAAARDADPRIRRSEGAEYFEALGGAWIANTNGLFRHYRKTNASVSVNCVAEDGEEKQIGDASADATHWSDLPKAEAMGRRAADRAVRLIGGQPVATGRYPIVFSPDAGFSLLIYVSNALNGEHLSRKRSWLAERAEGALGSAQVTIRDDARKRGGVATAPYDAEGTDTRTNVLIEAGQLRGKLLDLASGKRLGAPSTGNAQRGGYAGLPAIGAYNLYLEPGTQSVDELIAPIDAGLWVWGLSGWWIGLDPSNPQFSSAAYGLWIEKGKPVRPVARVTIAGPLEEILGGIEAVGNDLVWDHAVKTPTFRTAPLLVSGT